MVKSVLRMFGLGFPRCLFSSIFIEHVHMFLGHHSLPKMECCFVVVAVVETGSLVKAGFELTV